MNPQEVNRATWSSQAGSKYTTITSLGVAHHKVSLGKLRLCVHLVTRYGLSPEK